jgi:uncharacterized membrane protein YoaT (DUF817 family)
MSLRDRLKTDVAALDAAVRPWAAGSKLNGWAYEFLLFGLKQGWACLFGGLMLALLVLTKFLWPADAPMARYDFLVVASIAIQAVLIATRLERWDEAVVIFVFHIVGTVMEIFKVAHGSWLYPEDSVLRIAGVPLFSGFMYACIGSYIARIMRIFDVTFIRYPPEWMAWTLAVLSYLNFFSHHYLPDIRLGLFAFSALIFARCWFTFTPDVKTRRMPFLLGAVLVALFIWIAENVGTFASAWVYPSQQGDWRPVSIEKMGAWYLLIMLSFVLATIVHRPRRAVWAFADKREHAPAPAHGSTDGH